MHCLTMQPLKKYPCGYIANDFNRLEDKTVYLLAMHSLGS
ncbi:hypothetical protein DSUL_20313 [Desulfovibrionales bacterium]